jgi:DNA polymerase I
VIISGSKIKDDEFIDARLGSKTLFVDRAEDPGYASAHNCCIDTEYYVEKQILPPVQRIFDPFGITREQLIPNSKRIMYPISRDVSKDLLRSECEQSNLSGFGGRNVKQKKQRSLLDFE